MNPNNCSTCDWKKNPQGGWCYMFALAPRQGQVCMQHTKRTAKLSDLLKQVLTNQPESVKEKV